MPWWVSSLEVPLAWPGLWADICWWALRTVCSCGLAPAGPAVFLDGSEGFPENTFWERCSALLARLLTLTSAGCFLGPTVGFRASRVHEVVLLAVAGVVAHAGGAGRGAGLWRRSWRRLCGTWFDQEPLPNPPPSPTPPTCCPREPHPPAARPSSHQLLSRQLHITSSQYTSK